VVKSAEEANGGRHKSGRASRRARRGVEGGFLELLESVLDPSLPPPLDSQHDDDDDDASERDLWLEGGHESGGESLKGCVTTGEGFKGDSHERESFKVESGLEEACKGGGSSGDYESRLESRVESRLESRALLRELPGITVASKGVGMRGGLDASHESRLESRALLRALRGQDATLARRVEEGGRLDQRRGGGGDEKQEKGGGSGTKLVADSLSQVLESLTQRLEKVTAGGEATDEEGMDSLLDAIALFGEGEAGMGREVEGRERGEDTKRQKGARWDRDSEEFEFFF